MYKTLARFLVVFVVSLCCCFTMAGIVSADDDSFEIEIQVSPGTIAEHSQSVWVTVHCDIAYSAVKKTGITMNGVPSDLVYADDLGRLVVKFKDQKIKDIVEPPFADLTLTGETLDDRVYYGTDRVKVTDDGEPKAKKKGQDD